MAIIIIRTMMRIRAIAVIMITTIKAAIVIMTASAKEKIYA